jgi:hypothetical protein
VSSQLQVSSRRVVEAIQGAGAGGEADDAAAGVGVEADDPAEGAEVRAAGLVGCAGGEGCGDASFPQLAAMVTITAAVAMRAQRSPYGLSLPRCAHRRGACAVCVGFRRQVGLTAAGPYYDVSGIVERPTARVRVRRAVGVGSWAWMVNRHDRSRLVGTRSARMHPRMRGPWRGAARLGRMNSAVQTMIWPVNQEGDMFGRWAWCVVVICAGAVVGCGQKVDCEAFCAREAACAGEIAIALRSATPEQIGELGPDDRRTLSDRQLKRCKPNCASPTMPSSMHTKWIECLKLSDCKAFAECVYH